MHGGSGSTRDQFRRILREDGYRNIPPMPLEPGDVVLYGRSPDKVDHVGMVHRTQIALEHEVWVRSKWGQGGVSISTSFTTYRPCSANPSSTGGSYDCAGHRNP